MPKVQAWELLNDKEYSGRLNMSQFYKLLLQAGYDNESAQKAANKRGWIRLSAGMNL